MSIVRASAVQSAAAVWLRIAAPPGRSVRTAIHPDTRPSDTSTISDQIVAPRAEAAVPLTTWNQAVVRDPVATAAAQTGVAADLRHQATNIATVPRIRALGVTATITRK